MKRTLEKLLAAACVAAALLAGTPSARAADELSFDNAAEMNGRTIHLALNKSMVVDLPEDVRDVMVSSPTIADAVIRSNRKIYLIGVAVGETNVFLFGDGNRQIAQFELVVARDTAGLGDTIARSIPGAKIRVESLGDSLVLSGTAPSVEASTLAAEIAAKFIGDADGAKVVNTISVAGSDQVNLRVVIAEVQRNTAKQLGVDFSFSSTAGGVTFNPVVANPFGVAGSPLTDSALNITGDFNATVRALAQDGVLKTLAEPNLTAVSGEAAAFLVGGEFPTVVGIDENGRVTYEFKPYGVSLNFTPVVLSPGRISLKIKTEISEIDNTSRLTIGGGGNDVTILGFKTRRAETTVELPSGGSLAIGGLVKDDVRQSLSGIPALMELPVLGALFKSRDFQRQQTELVIFVTPYVVDPVATSALVRPDKNLNFTSDAQGYFLNQINKIYRTGGASPAGTYHGRFGFAYE
jgi:pilus assembly protein CpaC